MQWKVLSALSLLGSFFAVGCSGGSGGGGTPPASPTITAVSLSCTPTSVQTGQTSQCAATVSGTGSYSSAITWSAVSGTISSSGLYTAPATVPASGTDTITVKSTQDSTKSGNATIAITLPPTITSVTVSCTPTTLPDGQTSQCTATVQGTGNFNPAVSWLANLGTIASTGNDTATYTAPSSTTGPASVTATSSTDGTKLGTIALNITRTPPSGSWQPSGPPGGTITVLAEDPSNPSTIYADADNVGGFWKSTDAGMTWTSINTNSGMDYLAISDIVVANAGQTIYASSSGNSYFFWSNDAGNTWNQVQAPNGNINGMAVDPKTSSTIYLSAVGAGVLKSVDGGEDWALLAASPVITPSTAPGVLHGPIAVDPTTTTTVYYGTDQGLYISSNGGSTWSASSNGIASADTTVRDLAVDSAAPSSIFLLIGTPSSTVTDLYLSVNGGSSWTPLAVGLDAERIVPDPSDANVIYLYGLQLHSVYKSTDGGNTFVPSDTGTPSAGSTGSSSSSIALSGPTGTMIPITSSLGTFLMTIGGSGIYQTQNAAQSWSFSSQGLSAWLGTTVAFDPEIPATIYFGASGAGIFRSTDSGLTWKNLRLDSPTAIAVDPFDSAHILAAAYDEGLIESRDGGASWTNVSSLLPPHRSQQ